MVFNVPEQLHTNELASWSDGEFTGDDGVDYIPGVHVLEYTFAGASLNPVKPATSVVGGEWKTAFDSTKAALMVPGNYWWQVTMTAAGIKYVAGEGRLIVEKDLSAIATGTYDGRTLAQKAVDALETAYSNYTSSSGAVKQYTIMGRTMVFQDAQQILDLLKYWKGQLANEEAAQAAGGGRNIYARFNRAK